MRACVLVLHLLSHPARTLCIRVALDIASTCSILVHPAQVHNIAAIPGRGNGTQRKSGSLTTLGPGPKVRNEGAKHVAAAVVGWRKAIQLDSLVPTAQPALGICYIAFI